MKVMGIDPSTCSGYVVASVEAGRPVVHAAGEVQFKGLRGTKRAREIAVGLAGVATNHNPSLVTIEGYAMNNRSSLVTLVEIGTLIRDRLWKSGFQYVDVAPTQLKKFVLGTGAGKKDEVRLGVYKRWGFEDRSDNVIDAYVLACIGLAARGKLTGLIKPQVEVIDKLPALEGAQLPRRVTLT